MASEEPADGRGSPIGLTINTASPDDMQSSSSPPPADDPNLPQHADKGRRGSHLHRHHKGHVSNPDGKHHHQHVHHHRRASRSVANNPLPLIGGKRFSITGLTSDVGELDEMSIDMTEGDEEEEDSYSESSYSSTSTEGQAEDASLESYEVSTSESDGENESPAKGKHLPFTYTAGGSPESSVSKNSFDVVADALSPASRHA